MRGLKVKEIIIKLSEDYGFKTEIRNKNQVVIKAIDTEGKYVDWIGYYLNEDRIRIIGNTDKCNIWFHITRPDMTPDKIIKFVEGLNKALGYERGEIEIRELVDAEDWQEIADVQDAYTDERYYRE